MKTFLFLLALALIGAAYVAGYLPEHRRLIESQQELRTGAVQLADAQARLRLYALHTRLVGVIEAVREKNYGDAAKLSSEFFDGTRAAVNQSQDAQVNSSLEAVLAARDTVTSRLAMADPSVLDVLNGAMVRLQPLLESPSPSRGTETGAPAPAPVN
jgi:hypothetical protein